MSLDMLCAALDSCPSLRCGGAGDVTCKPKFNPLHAAVRSQPVLVRAAARSCTRSEAPVSAPSPRRPAAWRTTRMSARRPASTATTSSAARHTHTDAPTRRNRRRRGGTRRGSQWCVCLPGRLPFWRSPAPPRGPEFGANLRALLVWSTLARASCGAGRAALSKKQLAADSLYLYALCSQERTAPTKRPNGERNFGGQGGTCHHCRRSSGNTRGCILTSADCACARRLKKPAYFHEGCLRLYYARQLVRHPGRARATAGGWGRQREVGRRRSNPTPNQKKVQPCEHTCGLPTRRA